MVLAKTSLVQPLKRAAISRRRFLDVATRSTAGLATLMSVAPTALAAEGTDDLVIEDSEGVLGRTQAPVTAKVVLSDALRRAAAEGRLVLRETGSRTREEVPAQLVEVPTGGVAWVGWLMPTGPAGRRSFKPVVGRPGSPQMHAGLEQDGPQFVISDQARSVLRYNYAKVEAGAVWSSISAENRKYAVARSDYIHPLYGPGGEVLTKDWSPDHPHHRGIYWAWPEVDWHGQRGDLHALQKVFARPTGKCQSSSGPVFAQLDAENTWNWETGERIVRERALIRAFRHTSLGRLVDLEFHFEALGDPVLLARRDTTHYGGLNLRLSAVRDQRITKHTDAPSPPQANQDTFPAVPRAAWSDLSGLFPGAAEPAGLAVIQHASNPDYPGDWIDYPELNWVQPTFPAAGTRYALRKGSRLVLRFRLWIHPGGSVTEGTVRDQWQGAHDSRSPLSH